MNYIGNIFRPPSEANSLILQITVGCSHNKCTFCSMYKDKSFYVKKLDDIISDINEVKNEYGTFIKRVFLADGDAFVLSTNKLNNILDLINDAFPNLERITAYASPKNILAKDEEDLKSFRNKKLSMLYIGAESGDDNVLKDIDKGANKDEIINAIKKVENTSIKTSVTIILGIASKKGSLNHAINSAKLVNKAKPSYISLLTLMIDEKAPIYNDIINKKFELLDSKSVINETINFIKNISDELDKNVIFRSNHASNYYSLKGELPMDKERLLRELDEALNNTDLLKDEAFRLL